MARPQISNIGEGLEKVELSCIIGKSVKWYSHFGKLYPSFSEHTTTLKPNNYGLKYLPKVHENTCPQKTCTKTLIAALVILASITGGMVTQLKAP